MTSPEELAELETNWKLWLIHHQRPYLRSSSGGLVPFAGYHEEFWDYIWRIERGQAPMLGSRAVDQLLAIWPRGGAKSTSIELGVAALAARKRRRYGLYVSGTQKQADDHVGNVANMLTAPRMLDSYPDVGARREERYGRGAWKRNRIQTNSGFTLDALGLDGAVRGIKQEDQRPDLIVLDDIDDVNDSLTVTERKESALTKSILPSIARGGVVVFVQNLILEDGIAGRIVSGRADYMRGAIILGPHPAVLGLQYEGDQDGRYGDGLWHITAGTPTWKGLDLRACEALMNLIGPESFLAELQHDTTEVSDRVHPDFSASTHLFRGNVPPLVMVAGGLDFGGEGNTANESAGIVAGFDENDRAYLLAEFKDNGSNVEERQMAWMAEQEARWKGPGSITWAGDSSEDLGLRIMRRSFSIQPSQRGGREPMREARVRLVGRRLAKDASGIPGLRYLPHLRKFEAEMLHYRRQKPTFEGDTRPRKLITVNDHLMTAIEYLFEMVDGPRGPEANPEAYRVAVRH